MGLFSPIILQTIHALENHEHSVCSSKTEKHIHQKTINCSEFHWQLTSFTYDFWDNETVIPKEFYSSKFINNTTIITIVYLSKKSSRGPPYFIV